MSPKIIYIFIIASLFTSCISKDKIVSNKKDYEQYLLNDNKNEINIALVELNFWNTKLDASPHQFPFLLKRASANTELFKLTGKIDFLTSSGQDLLKANEQTNFKNASFLRSLSRNYIMQHRFDEAKTYLKIAEELGENKNATNKMLFDIELELGNDSLSTYYLSLIKNTSEFDYLIRASKFEDQKGKLESAILLLEKAAEIASKEKNIELMQWSFTNLADFYGHANRINKSYEFYLRSLAINPKDVYALKGIAWIIFSHEKNTKEANRIITKISNAYQSPDYYLMKSEIAKFEKNKASYTMNLNLFLKASTDKRYGNMYNKYNADLYNEELILPNKALEIAEKEIKLRPTPQSYCLKAMALYNKGEKEIAREIIKEKVIGKTNEPKDLYSIAKILNTKKDKKLVEEIKIELSNSLFELGPNMISKINLL